MTVKIKWLINGLNYGISSQNKVYRLEHIASNRFYPAREIELKYHQGQNKYTLNSKRYTERQLNDLSVKLKKEMIIEVPSIPLRDE